MNPFDNNQRLVTNEKDMNNNTRYGTPIDRKHQPLADQTDQWIISESSTSTTK